MFPKARFEQCEAADGDHEGDDEDGLHGPRDPGHAPAAPLAGLLLRQDPVPPVRGQVEVEPHQRVGRQPQRGAQHGGVEQPQHGQLQPQHRRGEPVQLLQLLQLLGPAAAAATAGVMQLGP